MKKVMIANDKGGVGKSLIAQFCVLALEANGNCPDIVEYDNQPKLRSLFGPNRVKTHKLGSAATISEEEAVWDPLLDNLISDTALVADFGAQAWTGFTDWAKNISLAQQSDGKDVFIVVPVTADREALNGAIKVLKTARQTLPKAQVHIVKVDKDGDVDDLKTLPEFKLLFAMAETCNAKVSTLPTLRAKGLPTLFAMDYSLDRIVNTPPTELPLGDLPLATRLRLVTAVKTWLVDANKALLPSLVTMSTVGGQVVNFR